MNAYEFFKTRGVTRLCHFTKLKMLTHILSSNEGILASACIRSDVKTVIDADRYEGEPEYVCCSIEYPNSWFLSEAQRRDTDQIFRDWVVLYINLRILNYRDAKFCPCNASKGCGRYIFSDLNKLITLYFSPTVVGRLRTPNMLECCPTDDQAEILIKNSIPRDYITGIAVGNNDIAERVSAILKTYSIFGMRIFIAPDVVSTNWSRIVRNGKRPDEILFEY
ncbi:DUF4433 domain-containing protein [Acetivibrio thermocellus]|uniref:DarT ssDNA thymidine ADP-ribosyltransferase family protein n=1 Tax=Acetivibrio thermocellus TaxID=1515 RepID=UPI00017E27A8|nr:DarT ssDNA thymidine ADP-ribosyltransferase family protein [Acetivibrio thermocellus]UWV46008.1 DUF4433 domain-containing protein [Acetivibrio thermocellus]